MKNRYNILSVKTKNKHGYFRLNEDKKKYYLGLDIGIGSVGWGIIGEENGNHWLEDFGVRLFSVPEEQGNLGKKSLAEKRRGFRSQRRLLNRWHCRREELKNFLLSLFEKDYPELAALLTCKYNCKWYCKHWKEELANTKKTMNFLPDDLEKYEEKSKFFNPYVVRYQALSTKISLVDLLKILLHIGKSRGYRKFYLDDSSEEKEVKETQTAVREAEKLFQEKKYETVAEMVIKEEKFRHSHEKSKNLLSVHNHNPNKTYENKEEKEKKHRHFVFPRKLLEAETEKILTKQSKYYTQLEKNFQWKSGKLETKEFSAQEIIKAIIFRQRDFEDGPGPGDQEKNVKWKESLKEVHHRSIEETRGSCQYFPTEKRGWRCSLVFCLYQFINEFSKIGGLEIKEMGVEKVKEIHQASLSWVLSVVGYQPKNSQNQEKKVGTFRQQLEKFLKEMEVKPSFPTGIDFKVSFLDYLKEDKEFYAVLGKGCPSQFYLNYEDYQKTIFYQIGEIIFADVSPWRRKDKLTELAKKYSLEPFSVCLAKLKEVKEKSPAAVSFRYMIEAIKAFLEGEKYGEFQAKKEKLVNVNNKKEMWSPWMHPDLVRNPVVFRSFNQTRKILKNLFLRYPEGFATINIETGRDLWNSEEERNKIERKNQDQAKEKKEIVEKLKGKKNIPVNETNIKKYRLWEDQNIKLWDLKRRGMKKVWIRKTPIKETNDGGICLYCNQEIDDWSRLENFEIEHIIPQSKWANDSFNNLVLSCKECNNKKGENLPFHFFQKNKPESVFKKEWQDFKNRVDKLYKIRNPFKHKFLTLGEKENWENELEDFVSRNLNDTRMIATYLLRYIQNELNKKEEFRTKIATKEMKVQSIKGSMTSYFRKQLLQYKEKGKWQLSPFYYKEQLRSLTPYHHAIDAIVLAHFKSRAYIQLLEDLTKISQGKLKLKRGKITSEQLNSLFQEIVKKWRKPEWELKKQELFSEAKNALNFLESATKEVDISSFFPLPDLHDIIERRIPVQLEKKSEKESDWDPETNERVKEIVIAVEKVLTEEEYAERVKGMQGNIHYPYISYAVDRKVKKETVASEQAGRSKRGIVMFVDICEKLQSKEKLDLPKKIGLSNLVKKIGLGKLNSEYGEKYNFVIVKKGEDNYTIWDTSKYDAGFGVKKDGKAERIKNIELLRKKKSGNRKWLTKNYRLSVRPREVFTFENSEKVDGELAKLIGLPLLYTGTTGDNVSSINIVGLIYDKKENSQTIYLSEHGDRIIKISNAINNSNELGSGKKSVNKIGSSLKLLKINILGKKEK